MNACFRTKNDQEVEDNATFIGNGRVLLEMLIKSCNGKCNPIRGFSAEELKRATNNYDEQQVITSDSGYKLYKGFLQDRPVSVKKFKENLDQYNYSFNDIVYSSQMSVHNNFLKFLGCCLETQVPILVFEYVGNGTLADHIFGPSKAHSQPLLWKCRIKIAMDIANAVAYLHAAFPKPIIFRNIKPLNILLDVDEHYVAKLSDFSISISIPDGESHVQDVVAGAVGLIAPEYLATGYFNEKNDVFNFGVFLFVLLTGQHAADDSRPENGDEFLLVDHVKGKIENHRFNEILDPIIEGEGPWPGKEQQLQALTALALGCISTSAEDRPTMIDVAKQLRQMHQSISSS